MDSYKDKYDNIVSKLLELIEKEKLLDEVDKDLENNLKELNICSDDLTKLNDKYYDMKHKVICDKTNKCMGRLFLFTFSSGLLLFLFELDFLLVLLYIILNIIAHRNIYTKKINDRDYMFGELEQSLEYRELVEQIEIKKKELQKLDLEYERLTDEYVELCSEKEYLYRMLYAFALFDEVEKVVDVALENGFEKEMEYAENKGLVRKKLKVIDKKKDEF